MVGFYDRIRFTFFFSETHTRSVERRSLLLAFLLRRDFEVESKCEGTYIFVKLMHLVSCNLDTPDRTVIFVHHIEGSLFSGSMTTNSTLKYIIYSVCYTLIKVIILC